MKISSVEDKYFSGNSTMKIKDKLIEIANPLVMGILNCTPDSFYSDSRVTLENELLDRIQKMVQEGADIIDIGGYSTRPNAPVVSPEEEWRRIAPALHLLKAHFPDQLVSVDTFRSDIAEKSLNLGASIINDISSGQADPEMLSIVAAHQVPYIAMHGFHQKEQIHASPAHFSIAEMMRFFHEIKEKAAKKGIHDLILDPGFGFSKTIADNFEIMKNLSLFKTFDELLLVGISRKSMIYKTLNIQPEEALNGTSVLNTIALQKGASILRVHDVKAAKEVIQFVQLAN